MKVFHTLLAIAALALAGQVSAHSDEYLDSIVTPHGGQMRMAGDYHLELVVEPGTLTVYVTDHGEQAVASEGASGNATVLVGRTRTHIALQPDGGNRLKGSGDFQMDESMRVVVGVTMAGQAAEQARFTPLAPRAVPAVADHTHDHHHHHHH